MDKYRGGPSSSGPGSLHSEEDVNLSRIPVFVFPTSVYFNARDRDSLKQILTIYNPYEFPVRFKVLSNAPTTYTVIDPEGSIKSKNCVDLILRVSSVPPESSGSPCVEHKFRVQIYHYKDRKLIGRRDVSSIIHWGNIPPPLAPVESGASHGSSDFLQCATGGGAGSGGPSSSSASKEHSIAGGSSSGGGGGGMGAFLPAGQQPNYVVIITALVCIIGLMLPIGGGDPGSCGNKNEGHAGSSDGSGQTIASLIPSYLHVTVNQKMLAAYALGLVTMVIFRP